MFRKRFARALTATTIMSLILASVAFADVITADGDTARNGSDIQYQQDNPSKRPCTDLWTAENGKIAPGQVVVTYNGNTHYNVGATVTLTVTPTAAASAQGITATGGSALVPSGYDSNGDTFTIGFTTKVPATAADGSYDLNLSTSGPATQRTGSSNSPVNPYVQTDTVSISIDCAPDVVDTDGDTVADADDNCPTVANTDQADADSDGIGDACEADTDGDGVIDDNDNCVSVANTDQADADSDGIGDACEADTDGDGVIDDNDNCPSVANADQADADADGDGNVCDSNAYVPTVDTAALDATGDEGTTLGTSGAFDDQDGDATLTISKVSGDGTVVDNGDGTWSWSLGPTTDNGTGTVSVQADDGEHAVATDSFDWTAVNVAPVISAASFGSAAACPTTPGANNVNLTITFTDAGSADTHTADIDWNNDGIYDQTVLLYTSGTEIPHSYATAGTHTAKVKITDDDGAVSTTTPTATATVNYNLSSILQPINDTRNGQVMSLFKYGSTIPVKVVVTDCDGSIPSDLTLKVTWKQGLSQTPDGVAEVIPTSQADLGNTMRFSDGKYVLQLNSKNTTSDSTSGITIWVTIQETGQSVQANIGFRK